MDEKTLFFFRDHPGALALYETLEAKILEQIEDVSIRVQTSQISFYNKHMFACASFARVRKKRELPEPYLVVTFGLGRQVTDPRIAVSVQPYPGRWTHHVVIGRESQIDEVLMDWIREAAAFSAGK